jgi:hypothetical protein
MIADQVVCLSLLVTGRHRRDHETLTALDLLSASISREDDGPNEPHPLIAGLFFKQEPTK